MARNLPPIVVLVFLRCYSTLGIVLREISSRGPPPRHDRLNTIASRLLEKSGHEGALGHVRNRRAFGAKVPGIGDFAGTAFYPFAGADLFTVASLVPHARATVMSSLISVGDCDVDKWGKEGLAGRTDAVTKLFDGLFADMGYFGTIQMQELLDDSGYGVSPLLVAALKLMGFVPLTIECGSDVTLQGASFPAPPGDAVRIVYSSAETPTLQELVYVKFDLVTPSRGLDRLFSAIAAQGPLVSLLKATEYTLHKASHPGNREKWDERPLTNLIINSSEAIFQDDTGILASCLSDWSMKFFGNYTGPAALSDDVYGIGHNHDPYLHSLMCGAPSSHQHLPIRYGYQLNYVVDGCSKAAAKCGRMDSVEEPKYNRDHLRKSKGFAMLAVKSATPILPIEFGALSAADLLEIPDSHVDMSLRVPS